MFRFVLVGLLMAGLAACDLGASPTQGETPTIGADESLGMTDEATATESAEATESATTDESMAGTAACTEAWAEVDAAEVDSADDLDLIAEDVEATLDECDELNEWLNEAEDVVPDVDTEDIEAWLQERCSENDTLSEAPICIQVISGE